MVAKADDKPQPKLGDVIARGTLDDGRPYHDISLGEGKTYRLTRIWLAESDAAWDASQMPDDKFNPRLNGRMKLAASIVSPPTTIESFEKLTEVEVTALFRGYDRLNNLPPADDAGNA